MKREMGASSEKDHQETDRACAGLAAMERGTSYPTLHCPREATGQETARDQA